MTATGQRRRASDTHTSATTTGRVHVGRYILDVKSPAGTTVSVAPRRQRTAPPPELEHELSRDAGEAADDRTLVGRASALIDKAEDVTDKVEHATELVRALLQGRVPKGEAVADELDDLLGLLKRLDSSGRFAEAVRLGRPLCRLFALTLRWAALVESVRIVLHAGTALADPNTVAWSEHELGTLHQSVDHTDRARELLEQAREIRQEIGDEPGLQATDNNLGVLSARRSVPSFTAMMIALGVIVLAVAVLGLVNTVSGGSPSADSGSVSSTTTGSSSQSSSTSTTSEQSGAIRFAPSSVMFGSEQVGHRSNPEQVMLSNRGAASLEILSVRIIGAASGDFSISSDSCGGRSVPAGGSCVVTLTFTPTVSGPGAASLQIADNASSSTQPEVPISGTGTQMPGVTISPGQLSFASVAPGQTGTARTVKLINRGTTAVSVSSVELGGVDAGDFVIASNGCSRQRLAPNGTCVVAVTFTPKGPGLRTATLSIADNATPGTQQVTLSGSATSSPSVGVNPSQLSFGSSAYGVSTSPETVTVADPGSTPLVLSTESVGGTDPSDFEISSNDCASATVQPSGSCTLSVTFTPTAAGARTATLTIADNANPGTQQVTLSGTGTGAATGRVTPEELDFNANSDLRPQPKTVTLSDAGNAPLMVSSDAIRGTDAGDYTITSDQCSGQTIAPGKSCTVTISFTATVPGGYMAALTFADNAATATPSVHLAGQYT